MAQSEIIAVRINFFIMELLLLPSDFARMTLSRGRAAAPGSPCHYGITILSGSGLHPVWKSGCIFYLLFPPRFKNFFVNNSWTT
jgi:hypothetical protein